MIFFREPDAEPLLRRPCATMAETLVRCLRAPPPPLLSSRRRRELSGKTRAVPATGGFPLPDAQKAKRGGDLPDGGGDRRGTTRPSVASICEGWLP
jgi:hypothetical protein